MIVYIFDGYSGVYLREYTPQKNPKKDGEYLMPRFSTTIKPIIKQGYRPVFDGEKWVQTVDYSGKEIINPESGEKLIMNDFAEIPEGFMLYEDYVKTDEYKSEMAVKEASDAKNQLLEQIDALDKKRIRAVCEPSQKDENQTWLEYYTSQIVELRQQLQEL